MLLRRGKSANVHFYKETHKSIKNELFNTPLLFSQTLVVAKSSLSVVFGSREQLICFSRELLCQKRETHFTLQEALELTSIWLFAIQRKRISVFCFQRAASASNHMLLHLTVPADSCPCLVSNHG